MSYRTKDVDNRPNTVPATPAAPATGEDLLVSGTQLNKQLIAMIFWNGQFCCLHSWVHNT